MTPEFITDLREATTVLAQWLPWATVIGFAWHAYKKVKKSVTSWAGTLMDNHMAHAQASLERIEQLQEAQIELLTRIAEK